MSLNKIVMISLWNMLWAQKLYTICNIDKYYFSQSFKGVARRLLEKKHPSGGIRSNRVKLSFKILDVCYGNCAQLNVKTFSSFHRVEKKNWKSDQLCHNLHPITQKLCQLSKILLDFYRVVGC